LRSFEAALKGPVKTEEKAVMLSLIFRGAVFGPEWISHAMLSHQLELQIAGKVIPEHERQIFAFPTVNVIETAAELIAFIPVLKIC